MQIPAECPIPRGFWRRACVSLMTFSGLVLFYFSHSTLPPLEADFRGWAVSGFKNCRRSIRLVGLLQLREKGRQEPESARARRTWRAKSAMCRRWPTLAGGRFTRNVRFRIFAIDQVVFESETSSTTSRHVHVLPSLNPGERNEATESISVTLDRCGDCGFRFSTQLPSICQRQLTAGPSVTSAAAPVRKMKRGSPNLLASYLIEYSVANVIDWHLMKDPRKWPVSMCSPHRNVTISRRSAVRRGEKGQVECKICDGWLTERTSDPCSRWLFALVASAMSAADATRSTRDSGVRADLAVCCQKGPEAFVQHMKPPLTWNILIWGEGRCCTGPPALPTCSCVPSGYPTLILQLKMSPRRKGQNKRPCRQVESNSAARYVAALRSWPASLGIRLLTSGRTRFGFYLFGRMEGVNSQIHFLDHLRMIKLDSKPPSSVEADPAGRRSTGRWRREVRLWSSLPSFWVG